MAPHPNLLLDGVAIASNGYHLEGNILWFVELNNLTYAYLIRKRGVLYLNIREFAPDHRENKLMTTSRGVELDRQQTRDFMSEIPDAVCVLTQVRYTKIYILVKIATKNFNNYVCDM
jgi:hypothetical protein